MNKNSFKVLGLCRLLVVSLCAVLLFTGGAYGKKTKKKADQQTEQFRYEIVCTGTGLEGTVLLKVWSFSRKSAMATEQSKKNAVHGVVFKGYANPNGGGTQKPLVKEPLTPEQEQYFEVFFSDEGQYLKYVTLSNDAQAGLAERIKVGKEYKVGVLLAVSKDELRRQLERDGVIKRLDFGF